MASQIKLPVTMARMGAAWECLRKMYKSNEK